MKKYLILAFVFCFTAFFYNNAYPQTPPPGQTGGGIDKTQADLERQRELTRQITTKKEKPEEAVIEEKAVPLAEGKSILVNDIEVRDSTLVSKGAIDKITAPYKGKELSLTEMQKICDLITDEYRKKGQITSRAYLPPQSIKDGLLVIMVVEGRLGTVEVKGNRYFKSNLIKKKLKLKAGDFFDYKALQKSLVKINEHPDRFVKSVLVPGKEPGTTDIVLEVEEKLPIHIGYEYDNFGSRYINYDRHTVTAEHNNLLGLDDKFYFKYQKGQNEFFDLTQLRYAVPLFGSLEAGAYWLWSTSRLGKEFKANKIKGESEIGGAFLTAPLIDTDNVDLRASCGFDYKHIRNYTNETKASRDEARVVKAGFDLDMTDKWGRTVISVEEDVGLSGGDLHKKDPSATRAGAGAEFGKLIGNIYRLQPMPFSSYILWKNGFQATNYNMLAVEQFQLGGITTVRSYAPAEYSGDSGLSSTVEWSFPPYGLPKEIRVPLSKSTFYDATRLVAFYDMGYVHLKNPLPTEKKDKTIHGWGFGMRFNLPEDFFTRFEVSYRLDRKAQFDTPNAYIDVGKKF
ncbi:MAG: hypothetical protein A3C51_02150 [Omnitrophica bacterium RIFCSPHIGHO2_02_FULL_46_20]|nr:MAG: hypothetical protein A3C51_02150 [Omnitrophica bacterium RIFCSPHIGHO2_02_FULL_46_20]